ncbi:MAG: hypothetical protein R3E79_42415 [Caldilineaceae bacterium]
MLHAAPAAAQFGPVGAGGRAAPISPSKGRTNPQLRQHRLILIEQRPQHHQIPA